MSTPKKLNPSRNPASYPTLKDIDRRVLLATVGAAALAVGLSCSIEPGVTTGVMGIDERDAAVVLPDAGSSADRDAGSAVPDVAYVP
ncbi:MAG: hypothetical protein QM765_39555 [Myxococcales bacterium]